MLLESIFRILMQVNSLASILPSRLGSHPRVLKLILILDFSADSKELQFFKDFVSMPASKSAYSCRTQRLHPKVFATSFFW